MGSPDTPTTGGTALDAKGNICPSVRRITPTGKISTLIADPRLD